MGDIIETANKRGTVGRTCFGHQESLHRIEYQGGIGFNTFFGQGFNGRQTGQDSWDFNYNIICDFCHKIWDVKLNPKTGTPYSNRPGVISLELLRPPEGHQIFIGPFDDVA